jgi:hypothetical protein
MYVAVMGVHGECGHACVVHMDLEITKYNGPHTWILGQLSSSGFFNFLFIAKKYQ